MWQRILKLTIAMALAGGASAQQNDKDALKLQDEKAKAAAEEDAARATRDVNEAVRRAMLMQAQRAQVQAEQARLEEQRAREEAMRAKAELDAQRVAGLNGMANPNWARFARQTKKEKVTYCGVSTTEPPPVLSEQLKLTRGLGLVIDFVEPKSPAEAAGLKQYDVITKFDDQILSNADQLGVLVRLKKFNDDAKLTVIRQGQPISVNVELGQKEMEVEVENANAGAQDLQPPQPWAIQRNGQLVLAPTPPRFRGGGGGMAVANVGGNGQMAWSDGQHDLTLDLQNGKAVKMVAKDKNGTEVFNGPIETEDQRKALPADLAEKLRRAEDGGPMRLNLGGRVPAQRLPRARVLTSTNNDTLLLARIENGKATHAFAFSMTDGKTLFDGPTTNEEERKAIPAAVARQLDQLEKNPTAGSEFGVVGRN